MKQNSIDAATRQRMFSILLLTGILVVNIGCRRHPIANPNHQQANDRQVPKQNIDPKDELTEGAPAGSQMFNSSEGRFGIPLFGSIESWKQKMTGNQETFAQEEGDHLTMVTVAWDVDFSDDNLGKYVDAHKASTTALGGKWRTDFGSSVRVGGKEALKYGYENRPFGIQMYATCATVRNSGRRYTITAVSSRGYQEADDLFERICIKIQFEARR